VLSLTLSHRLSTTLCRDSTAVEFLIVHTASEVRSGDGKQDAGSLPR